MVTLLNSTENALTKDNNPRVFVVNQPMRFDKEAGTIVPAIDLSPAEEFGQLEFLLPDGELQGSPEEVVEEIREGLEHFTKDDFLLLTGDPRAIAWAAVIAAERSPVLQLLHWSRVARRYRVASVPLRGGKVRVA